MNGEKDSADIWGPATVPATPPTYEQQLTAAGYGADQRARYIAESGQDPEYAACVWDEEVIGAAVAAGTIPEHTAPYTPAEEATVAARSSAMSEFLDQHPDYDALSNSPENQALFRQAMDQADQKARETLGHDVAEHLLSTPRVAEHAGPAEDDLDFDM